MVADVVEKDGMLNLENIRSFEPGGKAFYENHGFSPNGEKLIFTHNTNRGNPLRNNIHTMWLATGKFSMQLTDGGYNEHAHYSPDGRQVAWMSSIGNTNLGTDFWIMDADGTNKRRLTYFNVPGSPDNTKLKAVASDLSWNPGGTAIIGYVQVGAVNNPDKSKTYEERIAIIPVKRD